MKAVIKNIYYDRITIIVIIIIILIIITAWVSVLSNDPAVATAGVQVELLSHQVAETGRVQVGAAADDAVLGQTAQLPGYVGQDIH